MGHKKIMMRTAVLFAVLAMTAFVVADELKDLSSADVAAPESKVVTKEEDSNLRESAGFGGSLMTSGSFTMMASTGFEEEGELGESAGFGGALMTSGSFTMMASTGFEE